MQRGLDIFRHCAELNAALLTKNGVRGEAITNEGPDGGLSLPISLCDGARISLCINCNLCSASHRLFIVPIQVQQPGHVLQMGDATVLISAAADCVPEEFCGDTCCCISQLECHVDESIVYAIVFHRVCLNTATHGRP